MNTSSINHLHQQMHKASLLLILTAIILTTILLTSCGGDDPTAAQVMTKELTANAWKVSSVTVDAMDKTDLFTNMTLTFTNTNYVTTNGGVVWPASGTWEFIDKEAKIIIRNDELEIEITEITSASLKLSFNWTRNTFEPGRVSSVAGEHVFTFVKN